MLPLILLAGAGIGLWLFTQTQTQTRDPDSISRTAHSRQKEILVGLYPLASDIINQWDWIEEWQLELTDMQNDARELHNQRSRL